jgi:RNase H-fold protein (predicted Holliday junction resolvase)
VAADQLLAEAGVRRRDRKSRIDRAAATLILQGYLDSRKTAALAVGGGGAA